MMLKNLLALGLALFLTGSVFAGPPRHALSAEGCYNVAIAVGYAAHKAREGDTTSLITKTTKVPPVFEEHIRLLEAVVLKWKKVDPQSHFEQYYVFCMDSDGDLELMNNRLMEMLGEKVANSVL